MKLESIDRLETISKKAFIQNYLKPQKPLVIENGIEGWKAFSKWNLDYMSKIAGDKTVPLYDDRPISAKNKFNEAHASMKMSAYVNLLKTQPTRYRIFLWNILKEVPQLQNDFSFPDLGIRFLKSLPMLFFGGKDSFTFMHYDIDLANILHIHFDGKKEVILFDQNQTKFLYKVPHSLITREDIDFSNPDYEKWPALKKAVGYKTELNHGEVLYMPEGYWHYMKYITPGFSMSLRGIPRNPKNLGKAVYNIFVMRHFDNLMRKLHGQKWIDSKNEKAISKTHKKLHIKG